MTLHWTVGLRSTGVANAALTRERPRVNQEAYMVESAGEVV